MIHICSHWETRWAILVFMDEADLNALHRRECIREERDAERLKDDKRLDGWEDYDFIGQMVAKYGLRPFWAKTMQEATRDLNLKTFLRAIYPAWKGLEGQGDSEIEWVHKADRAIYYKGVKPNRGI